MNITQIIKLGFDLMRTKRNHVRGNGEEHNPYKFMWPLRGQYYWTSRPSDRIEIQLEDNHINFSTTKEPLYQICELFENNEEDPTIKNVIVCDENSDDIIIIQRFGNSTFYITDNNIPENAAKNGLLQEIDILNFTEEQYFQLNVLYNIPSFEHFKTLADNYRELQQMSTDNSLELTIVWSAMPDLNNIHKIKEEDFDGYRFE